MKSKQRSLFALILIAILTRNSMLNFQGKITEQELQRYNTALKDFINEKSDCQNYAEQILALGQKLKFRTCELYSLELIPKISDKIGLRLLAQKFQILGIAASLQQTEKYQALEVVYGIGPKEARRLGEYLSLE